MGDSVKFPKDSPLGTQRTVLWPWIGAFIAVFLGISYVAGIILPPRPAVSEVLIERGAPASEIARSLKEAHVIRSERLFVWAVYFSGVHDRLGTGRFMFDRPQSLVLVIRKLLARTNEVVLLVREGERARDIAGALAALGLDGSGFLVEAERERLEGYLFPDTYRLYESATAKEVVRALRDNFEKKIAPLRQDIAQSGRVEREVVIMASIIEREVRSSKDRKIIAGILWKRLDAKMPLQADATLHYENGKASHELTEEDLTNPSPYNTYAYKGLPPTPISNPGLDAIEAAVRPAKTDYWYYLSGDDGTTHFARTFEEHKLNKAKFLR